MGRLESPRCTEMYLFLLPTYCPRYPAKLWIVSCDKQSSGGESTSSDREGNQVCNENFAQGHDTTTSNPLDGSADEHGCEVLSNGRHKRPDEKEQRRHKDKLHSVLVAGPCFAQGYGAHLFSSEDMAQSTDYWHEHSRGDKELVKRNLATSS